TGSWSTSSNTFFSTVLGLCSPRSSSSDKIEGDRTQIYRIFADFFHGIQLGDRSSNFDKKTTQLGLRWGVGTPAPTFSFLQCWGSVAPGAPAPTKTVDVSYRDDRVSEPCLRCPL